MAWALNEFGHVDEDEVGYDKDEMMGDGNGGVGTYAPPESVGSMIHLAAQKMAMSFGNNIPITIHTTVAAEQEKRVGITVADRKAALRRQQEEIAVRLDRLERIPNENPFEEGDVFKLTKNWGGETEYTFVVLYVNGTFYTTGRQRNTAVFLDWESFVNWAGEQAFRIEKATQWETIVE